MGRTTKSNAVLVHPDFSITRTLRGYKDFEDVYQGVSSTQNVIWLSDRPSGKDPQAEVAFTKLQSEINSLSGVIPPGGLVTNDTAISPWLQRGVPVPLGATIVVWLPYFQANVPAFLVGRPNPMEYIVAWRTRSPSVYRQNRQPYHDGFDGIGQTDDGSGKNFQATGSATPIFTGTAKERRVIQGSWECLRYAQTEPTVGTDFIATEDVWSLKLSVAPTPGVQPLPPLFPYFKTTAPSSPVLGDITQGVLKNGGPGFFPFGTTPLYVPVTMKCKGDELILGVKTLVPPTELDPTGALNFDSNAYFISLFFGRAGYQTGHPDIATPFVPNKRLGAHISTGTAP